MKYMKKIINILLVATTLLILTMINSLAADNVVASGDCSADGSSVTWTYYNDETMVISGTGAMRDAYDYRTMWGNYKISNVIIEEGITYIAVHSFSEGTKISRNKCALKNVSLPNTLEKIGSYAFQSCIYLEKINIPDNVTEIGQGAFYYCKSLNNIKISNSIECIHSEAFYDCEKLSNVNLPDKGIIIERDVFYNTAIVNTESNYENGVLYIGKHIITTKHLPLNSTIKEGTKSVAADAFSESLNKFDYDFEDDQDVLYLNINLVDSIECIGYAAFESEGGYIAREYVRFTLSHLPKNIRYIGAYAFRYCNFQSSNITIPSVIETVHAYAFANCELENIVISDGVKNVEMKAFWGHFSNDIYIPGSVETIDYGAFVGCQLSNVYVSDDNQNYKDINGVLFSRDGTELLLYPIDKNAEVYNIPDGTEVIGTYAFVGRGAVDKPEFLKTVNIPASVVYVAENAFFNIYHHYWVEDSNSEKGGYDVYTGLENVIFETGKRNLIIESNAFNACYELTNIVIPDERVYAISAHSLSATGYFISKANWTGGALYLGKILLAIDPDTVSADFKVKEGTTVIADYVTLENVTDPTSIIDYIPDSVVVIGNNSMCACTDLPSRLKRLGTHGVVIDENELERIFLDRFGENNEKLDLNDSKCYELLTFNYVYDGWLVFNFSASPNRDFDQLYFVDKGVEGIIDTNDLSFSVNNSYAKGIILPQSLKTLGLFIFDDLYTYYYNEDVELSITFLNSNCEIFDNEQTINERYTICGYPGSTAEAYAKKYNRKFVDISNCTHELTCRRGYIESTCDIIGRTGDVFCQYCGEFLYEGEQKPTVSHIMGEWKIATAATCTESGTEERSCVDCGYVESRVTEPNGHDWGQGYPYFNYVWTKDATCTENEVSLIRCHNCSETKEFVWVGTAKGHIDDNADGICDRCGLDNRVDCSCNCHKSGFMGLIWKLILFFNKLFKTNQVCACGALHY